VAASTENGESGQVGQEGRDRICNKEIDFSRVGKNVLFQTRRNKLLVDFCSIKFAVG